jgi:DNA polymerase-4
VSIREPEFRGPEFLAPLPVGVLDPVIPKIEKRLNELGVSTVGQLAMIPERLLVRQFGPVGSLMRRQSLGEDWSHVRAAYPPEVITIEQTFEHSVEEPSEVEAYLSLMVDEALAKLRKRGSLAGEITLGLQISQFPIPNSKFQIAFFRFKKPTDSASAIVQALGKMLVERMQPGMEVSGVRIVFSDLTPGSSSQLSLIGDDERRGRIDRTVEHIRERFGERAILIASALAPTGRAGVLARIAA